MLTRRSTSRATNATSRRRIERRRTPGLVAAAKVAVSASSTSPAINERQLRGRTVALKTISNRKPLKPTESPSVPINLSPAASSTVSQVSSPFESSAASPAVPRGVAFTPEKQTRTCCYNAVGRCDLIDAPCNDVCNRCGDTFGHHSCGVKTILDLVEGRGFEEGDMLILCLPCLRIDRSISESDIAWLNGAPTDSSTSPLSKRIPFFDGKEDDLRNVEGTLAVEDLPADLDWSDGKRLLTIFKRSKSLGGKGRMIPQSLLKDAGTVADKVMIGLFWIEGTNEQQREWFEELKEIYRAPSKSNSPKKGRNATEARQQKSARASGKAASRTTEKFVGIADSPTAREEAARKSFSHKNTKDKKKQVTKGPSTISHFRNRKVNRLQAQMEKFIMSYFEATAPIEGCPAYNEPVLLIRTNVKDPRPDGYHARKDIILEARPGEPNTKPIIMAYAREESRLIEAAGGSDAMKELKEKYEVRPFYYANRNQNVLPTQMVQNQSARLEATTPNRHKDRIEDKYGNAEEVDDHHGSRARPRRVRFADLDDV